VEGRRGRDIDESQGDPARLRELRQKRGKSCQSGRGEEAMEVSSP
jgi:hypothetical protein